MSRRPATRCFGPSSSFRGRLSSHGRSKKPKTLQGGVLAGSCTHVYRHGRLGRRGLKAPAFINFEPGATYRGENERFPSSTTVPPPQLRRLCHVGGEAPCLDLGESSATSIEQINFHFAAVRAQPPVSHMAAALVPTFCSLYCTLHALCATDHNTLLEALVCMTVDAEQIFEKDHSISAHELALLLW